MSSSNQFLYLIEKRGSRRTPGREGEEEQKEKEKRGWREEGGKVEEKKGGREGRREGGRERGREVVGSSEVGPDARAGDQVSGPAPSWQPMG